MGTLTGQILVGEPHPNDDGLITTHCLFLSENSRPAWILFPIDIFGNTGQIRPIIWIPTLENMLEDAFLMIAIHILKDRDVIRMAEKKYSEIATDPNRVVLYEYFSFSDLSRLYSKCRQLEKMPKMVISSLQGSTIFEQLRAIEFYKMDVEVCVCVYSRLFYRWNPGIRVMGSL